MELRVKLPLLSVLLSCMLVACGSQPPVPEDRFYRLPDIQLEQTNKKPVSIKLSKSVKLERIHTEGLYQERAILYIDNNYPLELRRYHYHHWLNTPADMVSEHFLSYLRSAFPARKVGRYIAEQQAGDCRIGGKLIRFERIMNSGNPIASVALELWLDRGDHRHVFTKEYSINEQTKDGSMHATAVAFGKALEQTYEKFIQDLKKEQDLNQ